MGLMYIHMDSARNKHFDASGPDRKTETAMKEGGLP